MSTQAVRAYRVFLMLGFIGSLFFTMLSTIEIIYQVEAAGFNALQVVVAGSVLEATTFLCEIPTGVVADVYGRRFSILTGYSLMGLGFLLEGTFPSLVPILLAQVIWGLGYTFTSGAEEAWIADEVGSEQIGPVYMRGSQAAQLGSILGIVLSVFLASLRLNLPLLISGGAFLLLAGSLRLVMPEHGFERGGREHRPSWQAIKKTVRQSWQHVRTSTLLLLLFAITAFSGMSAEGFARLWTVEMLTSVPLPALGALKPVVWFGLFQVGAMILSILGTEIIKRRVSLENHRLVARVQVLLNVLIIVSVVAFALAPNFLFALLALWGTLTFLQISRPIYRAWLTLYSDPEVRATILSSASQMDSFGRILGGPIIGAIGVLISIRAALASVGFFLSPVLLLFVRAARQGREAAPDRAEPSEP